MRRVAPAITLFFLSPLVAEYLLGDFTLSYLPFLVLLGPMYGGGALLIRELTRRTGRGWPTMLLLGLAYGVFEEGVTTQSLFNRDYAHAHLLDHGYLPALGIAVPWTLYVLTLHAVWSVSVPIALTEGLVPGRRATPWLRTPGFVVAAVLFVAGAAATTAGSYANGHYWAPWPQLVAVLLVTVALVVVALRLPRTATGGPHGVAGRPHGAAPSPWLVFGGALVAGVLFELGFRAPAWVAVVLTVAALAGTVAAVRTWSRRAGWDARHRLALAAGALLTYAWHSFLTSPLLGGGPVMTPVSHALFALAAVALLVVELRRLPRAVPSADESTPLAEPASAG